MIVRIWEVRRVACCARAETFTEAVGSTVATPLCGYDSWVLLIYKVNGKSIFELAMPVNGRCRFALSLLNDREKITNSFDAILFCSVDIMNICSQSVWEKKSLSAHNFQAAEASNVWCFYYCHMKTLSSKYP